MNSVIFLINILVAQNRRKYSILICLCIILSVVCVVFGYNLNLMILIVGYGFSIINRMMKNLWENNGPEPVYVMYGKSSLVFTCISQCLRRTKFELMSLVVLTEIVGLLVNFTDIITFIKELGYFGIWLFICFVFYEQMNFVMWNFGKTTVFLLEMFFLILMTFSNNFNIPYAIKGILMLIAFLLCVLIKYILKGRMEKNNGIGFLEEKS